MFWWLGIGIVFFIIEAIIPGLISIWFGIAAMITMVISTFIDNIFYQFYIFIILSGIIFVITKNISKKWRERKKENIDRIRGQIVEIRSIKNNGDYEIYLDGKNWIGKSSESFEVGEKVRVARIEGIKLVLEKVD